MKKLNNLLSWYILITIIGLIIRYLFSPLWDFWQSLDVSLSIALGVLAFFAYKKILRDDDEIELILKTEEKEHNTNLTLLRKDCTRAEIMGLLGMIQKEPNKRFHIKHLQKPDFLKKLHHVQKGKDKRIIIMIREEEREQFVQTSKNGAGKKL